MEDQDKDWLNAQIDEIGISPEEFEMELWLSSDFKNTVKVKAITQRGRKDALKFAQAVYDKILSRYGSKQQKAVEVYDKPKESKKIPENCSHENVKVLEVKKEGKNQGRLFKTCSDCGSFLGWKS